MEEKRHENNETRIKREGNGTGKANDGRLPDNRRYSGKTQEIVCGTIELMLEAEMDEHLGYEKNSVLGNNTGNSRNGYGTKTIHSDYGDCEISVPRDRNGEFEPKVIEKRQIRTDEIEQKIMTM